MESQTCRVLLVDDDEDDYVVTRDFLDEAERLDFTLNWVDNYADGLAEIGKNSHDAYLLDFRLGKENGLELLRDAMQLGCSKPIILLTGMGDNDIDEQAMAVGAADYLVKGATLSGPLLERSILHAMERKRAESEQKLLVAELASANRELKDFAYVVSHDLKAPLRGIASIADWLQKDFSESLTDEGQEMLQLLDSRARRMDSMIDGVLQYSRVGRLREQTQSVDLNQVVAEVTDAIAPPPGIQITVETTLPELRVEQNRIGQVFQNLISNAVKYMGAPEGNIWIGHSSQENHWQFYVKDNGIGIDEKHFEKIFQIFRTLQPQDRAESTGVGLAIVKKIVELYGGHIEVSSTVGQGSVFSFTIPKVSEVKEREQV